MKNIKNSFFSAAMCCWVSVYSELESVLSIVYVLVNSYWIVEELIKIELTFEEMNGNCEGSEGFIISI